MKWLRKILGLCQHTYEPVGRGDVTSGGQKIGNYYIVRCSKCGHMREYEFT